MPQNQEFHDICEKIDAELEKSKLPNPHIQQTKIGHYIVASAVLYDEVRLNKDAQPEKIVKCYSVLRHGNFIGYETDLGNIYVIVGPYYAYWGYYDKNMNFHSLSNNPKDVLGVSVDSDLLKIYLNKLKWEFEIKRLLFWLKKTIKKKILLFNTMNLGHHIWNEQAGLDFFSSLGLLKKINKAGFYVDYFNTSKYLKDKYNIAPFFYKRKCFVSNDILVSFSSQTYYSETTKRLLTYCLDNSNKNDFIKNDSFVIIICLRWNHRVWVEEDDSIPKILNDITEKYNDVQFIIDGHSLPAAGYTTLKGKKRIKRDKKHLDKILNRLTVNARNKTKSIIGFNCTDKIAIYNKANLLVMPYGTPEHYNWIVQKSIITYGPKVAKELSDNLHAPEILSGIKIDNTGISLSDIAEMGNSLDYSMDYHILENLILGKIKSLQKRS